MTLANTAGVSLDLANDEAIGNLSGGGTTGGNVTLNGNTLTVNEAGTTTFSGVASGAGGLIKQGVGSLTLSGLNTYTGATAVNAGTLALGANNVLANGTQVVGERRHAGVDDAHRHRGRCAVAVRFDHRHHAACSPLRPTSICSPARSPEFSVARSR